MPALCVCVALQLIAGCMALLLKVLLERENRRLDRLEKEDGQLTEKDVKRLQKTADFEGIDVPTARRLQKSYRYMT